MEEGEEGEEREVGEVGEGEGEYKGRNKYLTIQIVPFSKDLIVAK